MSRLTTLLTVAAFTLFAGLAMVSFTYAQNADNPTPQHGSHFVDENGDGYNDNAPDADGDGIPNGQDPDYVRPNNGKRFGKGFGSRMRGFIDEDGDGINDRALDKDSYFLHPFSKFCIILKSNKTSS